MSVERIKSGRRRKNMKQDEGERSMIGHRKRGYVMNIGNGNKLPGGRKFTPKGKIFVFSVCLFVYRLFINTVNIS